MRLIKTEEEFLECYEIENHEVSNYDEMPKKYPFYMYISDGCDGLCYKALYSEDLDEMVSRLECVVL